jgi:hypothetical protein
MRNQSGLSVLLGSAGLGAALMFLLDLDHGTRRRVNLRDRLTSFGRLAAWVQIRCQTPLAKQEVIVATDISFREAVSDTEFVLPNLPRPHATRSRSCETPSCSAQCTEQNRIPPFPSTPCPTMRHPQ